MQIKKITAGLLAAVLAVTSLSETVFAAPVDTPTNIIVDALDADASEPADTPENPIESDFEYTALEGGTLEITGYTGSATELEIPSTIDGKTVTSIGDNAFERCSNLTSVNIPDGVTSIGVYAFSFCYSLTSIILPNSLTSIGEDAFWFCSKLTSVDIPDSVTSIEDSAFGWCENLTSIDIPNSVTSIGQSAFSDCSSLTSVTIPESVTSIGDMAFWDCSSLASINIPDGVTSIGDYAFSDCSSLTSITIPESVKSIGDWAFSGCASLASVTIPDSVTSIGGSAFEDCSSLTSITIPESVTSIGSHAFSNCTSLTSITVDDNNEYYSSRDGVLFNKDMTTLVAFPGGKAGEYVIPDSVRIVEWSVFVGSTNITSITIPDGVTSIESGAFWYCSSLTSINVDDNNEYYTSQDGVLFNKDMTELLVCPGGKTGEYAIPDGVTSIGGYAFFDCSNLKSIKIPDGVTSIESGAFWYCSSLTSITIPDGVTSIGDYAFEDCSSLTSVTIPDSVTSIGNSVFDRCSSLTSVNIPGSVTSIGDYAFYICSSLKSIDIPDGVTSIGDYAFELCESLTSVDIPDSVTSIGCYAFSETPFLGNQTTTVKYAGKWAADCDEDAVTAEIKSGTVGIAGSTFQRCSYLASITIPDSVTSIGDDAFASCENLTSIDIPDSVTSIGDGAFASCENLTSIDIPDSVTSIGRDAFYNTPLLDNQTGTVKYADKWVIDCDENADKAEIDSGAVGIADNAFSECSSLTSINIPDGVTSIGENAFSGCLSLDSITIPDSVTDIGDWAFFRCTSLTSIDIPDSVTSIGDNTFWGCSRLTSIDIPDSVTSISDSAFSGCWALKDVYYDGLKAQWDEITIGSLNEVLLDAAIHYGKHIATDPIIENEIPAACLEDGSYDEVVYCSDCGEELSRETFTVPAVGEHIPAESVRENVVDVTCVTDGSYDAVVYCSVCGEEIGRETVTVPATGKHTPAQSVKENEVAATCGADGSYDEVVYCSVCGEEIGRETVTVPATGKHTYVDKVVEPTYDAEGYTEHTCSVCGYSYKDNYTAKKTAPTPSSVTGLKLKGRAADALRLSWTKNTSADGYIIEMKDGSKWTRVVKITKNSTTEYRIAKLAAGTAYNFRIRAYKMDGKTALYSGYTSISARTNPSAISGLKLKGRAADALRLTWTKNTSADGYIIEMKSGSSWTRVGKITKNSTVEFKKSKLKAGTAYTFRVKAYKMSGKTALYGATKSISVRTNPSTTSGLKLKNSAKNAVRLSWSKNTSADGYIIEMKVNGVWKRASKITSNSTVEFKKSGLKSKTSYTFRVKTYKMSGKTALYGATKTITVKTK